MGALELLWNLILFVIVVLILLLPFAYDSQGPLHYHCRFAFYIVSVSFTSLVCIPLFALRPFDVRNTLHISYLLRHVTKVLGVTWEVRGAEFLSKDQGCIITANHQSILDILGMLNIWGVMGKCAAVAKKELFYVFPFGPAAWLGGIVYIDRLNSSKAHAQLNHASQLMKKSKIKLWMFPEGTRNPSPPSILPFKKGAFRVAIACQVPILPVVFSPYYFVNHEKKSFQQGKMIIQTLPQISTEGLTLDDLDSLMERTRNAMMKAFESLCNEIKSQALPTM